jgi:hypothetical protein
VYSDYAHFRLLVSATPVPQSVRPYSVVVALHVGDWQLLLSCMNNYTCACDKPVLFLHTTTPADICRLLCCTTTPLVIRKPCYMSTCSHTTEAVMPYRRANGQTLLMVT